MRALVVDRMVHQQEGLGACSWLDDAKIFWAISFSLDSLLGDFLWSAAEYFLQVDAGVVLANAVSHRLRLHT